MDLDLKIGDQVMIVGENWHGKVGYVVYVSDKIVCVDGLDIGVGLALYSVPVSDDKLKVLGWDPQVKAIDIEFALDIDLLGNNLDV